jgi:hypothetical protein
MLSSPEMLFLIALIATSVGAGCIWLGRRGLRIDRHPVCQACGFDLHGTLDRTPSCAECGGMTWPRERLRIGNRMPIAALICAGIVLLPVGILATGMFIGELGAMQSARYKPNFWLSVDAASSDSDVRDAALVELLQRSRSRMFKPSDWTSLVDRLLDIQADPDHLWTPMWGDLIESLHASSLVSQAQWSRYAAQCFVLQETVSPDYGLFVDSRLRCGSASPFCLAGSFQASSGDIGLRTYVDPRLMPVTLRPEWFVVLNVWQSNAIRFHRETKQFRIEGRVRVTDTTGKLLASVPAHFDIAGDDATQLASMVPVQ